MRLPFLIKFWLGTQLLGAFFNMYVKWVQMGDNGPAWLVLLSAIVVTGSLVSLPSLLLCYLSLRVLDTDVMKPVVFRTILGLETIVFTSITFFLIYGVSRAFFPICTYSLAALISAFVFSIDRRS